MASARQIAANRRNAKKSTGPRSNAGKHRAKSNAYRHGLASRVIFTAGASEQAAELTRAIAAGHDSIVVREWANTAAEAILDLARVRRLRGALMDEIAAEQSDGARGQNLLHNASTFKSHSNILDVMLQLRPIAEAQLRMMDRYKRLRSLGRYERRLAGRRDRAIRKIVQCTQAKV